MVRRFPSRITLFLRVGSAPSGAFFLNFFYIYKTLTLTLTLSSFIYMVARTRTRTPTRNPAGINNPDPNTDPDPDTRAVLVPELKPELEPKNLNRLVFIFDRGRAGGFWFRHLINMIKAGFNNI